MSSPAATHGVQDGVNGGDGAQQPQEKRVRTLSAAERQLQDVRQQLAEVKQELEAVGKEIHEYTTRLLTETDEKRADDIRGILQHFRAKETNLLEQKKDLIKTQDKLSDHLLGGPQQPVEDAEMLKYWEALGRASFDEKQRTLSLPDGVNLLGHKRKALSVMYVRESYEKIWQIMRGQIESTETLDFIVTGTPGVGKSLFVNYMLWHLRRRGGGVTVVYEVRLTDTKSKRCLFTTWSDGTSRALAGGGDSFERYLMRRDVFYVIDGFQPYARALAVTILVTSPNKGVYKEHAKQAAASSLYMPPWKWKEIEACRAISFPHVPAEVASRCFKRWGGVPRYVLERALLKEHQAKLEAAIAKANVKVCIDAVNEIAASEDIAHHLMHMLPVEKGELPYHTYVIDFASKYVGNGLTARLLDIEEKEFFSFLRSSRKFPTAAGLRGYFFETWAHGALRRGGTFEVRKLDKDKALSPVESLVLEPTERLILFHDEKELSTHKANEYLRPDIPNFKAADAVMKPDKLFQMTVSRKRPVKREAVQKLVATLKAGSPPTSTVVLYFVVPPDKFQSFPPQLYKNTDKKASKTAPAGVVQYALKIDIPHEGAMEEEEGGDDMEEAEDDEEDDGDEDEEDDDDMKDE